MNKLSEFYARSKLSGKQNHWNTIGFYMFYMTSYFCNKYEKWQKMDAKMAPKMDGKSSLGWFVVTLGGLLRCLTFLWNFDRQKIAKKSEMCVPKPSTRRPCPRDPGCRACFAHEARGGPGSNISAPGPEEPEACWVFAGLCLLHVLSVHVFLGLSFFLSLFLLMHYLYSSCWFVCVFGGYGKFRSSPLDHVYHSFDHFFASIFGSHFGWIFHDFWIHF